MAPNSAPRRIDEALRPGGLYYTPDGTAIDAEGRILEGAPKRPDDTPEHEQPFAKLAAATSIGAAGAPQAFDLEKMGSAIARGLQMAAGRAEANAESTATSADARSSLQDDAKNAKPAEGKPPVVDSSRAGPAPQAVTGTAGASAATGGAGAGPGGPTPSKK